MKASNTMRLKINALCSMSPTTWEALTAPLYNKIFLVINKRLQTVCPATDLPNVPLRAHNQLTVKVNQLMCGVFDLEISLQFYE